ncbi:TonB-dependent receptor SusC [termite gut metagenome]|uniref:TonB-dependent receptor SusC n=1 Tax=termite gut metagenome TaxID=433724 RepID=A0A5J4REV7_9ZZZZ
MNNYFNVEVLKILQRHKNFARRMKAALFMLILGTCIVSADNVYSQEAKLSFLLSDISIKQAIAEIEKQSDFVFIWTDNTEHETNKKINLQVDQVTIEQILNNMFANTQLSYRILGKQIVVYLDSIPKDVKQLKPSSISLPQQSKKTITGTVIDSKRETIIGANIIEKGTTNGVISDLNGHFSLQVSSGATLVISYIGYNLQEIAVGNKTDISIMLSEDSKVLEEVVVVGYGSTLRKNLTTAIAKVNADDVPKAALSNTNQMLLGRAAGLQATVASAQPGGAVDISIRGAGKPIYVVDGVVMPNDGMDSNGSLALPASINRAGLAGLNPDDIESIEILKDASASIYGIGAANGVILVTTKKGAEGNLKVSYSANVSLVKNYPYLEMLDAKEFMGYANLYKKEQYLYNNKMAPYGIIPYDNNAPIEYTDAQIANAQTTNWPDLVLRDGSINTHSVTVQGGSKQLNYYLSGNFFNQVGTVSKSDMERLTLQSRVSSQLFDFLKLSTAINYNYNNNNNGTVGATVNNRGSQASGALSAAMGFPPILPVRDENGDYSRKGNIPNPVGMEEITNISVMEGISMTFNLDLDIIKDMLSAKVLFGYIKDRLSRNVYIPLHVYYDQLNLSRGSLAEDRRQNETLEGTIAFNKTLSEVLRIDAVAGMGMYWNSTFSLGDSYSEINDVLGNDNIGAATGTHTPTSYRTANDKRSQFVRASFDVLDRYVVSASLRRDGTDKFFPSKKYALFPSVSVAWKVFNEAFLKDIKWIDMLKLRGSYGVTGADNLGTSLYGSYVANGNHVLFNNNSIIYIPFKLQSYDYPNVTWEKTIMQNIGIDFSLFKDKISGSFDVFQNDITDMLGIANSEGLSMLSTYPINGGHIRRYGWDASIKTKNIQTSEFRWTSLLTLSHYNSIWKERMPNYDFREYQQRVDEPVNSWYFYRTDGIVNIDKSNMPASQPEGYNVPGAPIIRDLNSDGQIGINDIEMVNVVPALYWGFGNTFTYKNWDLDVFLYSQLGLKKTNFSYSYTNGLGLISENPSNQSTLLSKVWNSQTNPNGILPGLAYNLGGGTLPGGAGTDVSYQDASFVRVRNITLGYNLMASSLGAAGKYISNIRVYVDVMNPFTFTSFTGFDPEVYTGLLGDKAGPGEYPQVRTFSVGTKITF